MLNSILPEAIALGMAQDRFRRPRGNCYCGPLAS